MFAWIYFVTWIKTYRLLRQCLFQIQRFAVFLQEPWKQFDRRRYKLSKQATFLKLQLLLPFSVKSTSKAKILLKHMIKVFVFKTIWYMSSHVWAGSVWEEVKDKIQHLQFVIEADLWSHDVSSSAQHVEADVILWTFYNPAWFIWGGHGHEAVNPPPDQSSVLIRFNH